MPKGILTTLLLLTATQQQTLPPNYTTILENPTFRIIKVHYGPHEIVPVHDHPDTPTVYVYLNNSGPVRITHEETDGTQSSLIRPPTHTGAFRVSPGMLERHSIENLSDLPSDFLRVELLGSRLADKALAFPNPDFRGPAPADLTRNLTATEFSSPKLTITRILCIDPTPCNPPATSAPSVLIAFSKTTVNVAGKPTPLETNNTLAIPANQPFAIAAPAHILQIAFATH
jgi:hypothetical protein